MLKVGNRLWYKYSITEDTTGFGNMETNGLKVYGERWVKPVGETAKLYYVKF